MEKKTSDEADWEAWQTSFMNETFTNLRRFTSIPFVPDKMERVRKGVTPREIVYEKDDGRGWSDGHGSSGGLVGMSEFQSYGFDGVLPKPWTPAQLSEVLGHCARPLSQFTIPARNEGRPRRR